MSSESESPRFSQEESHPQNALNPEFEEVRSKIRALSATSIKDIEAHANNIGRYIQEQTISNDRSGLMALFLEVLSDQEQVFLIENTIADSLKWLLNMFNGGLSYGLDAKALHDNTQRLLAGKMRALLTSYQKKLDSVFDLILDLDKNANPGITEVTSYISDLEQEDNIEEFLTKSQSIGTYASKIESVKQLLITQYMSSVALDGRNDAELSKWDEWFNESLEKRLFSDLQNRLKILISRREAFTNISDLKNHLINLLAGIEKQDAFNLTNETNEIEDQFVKSKEWILQLKKHTNTPIDDISLLEKKVYEVFYKVYGKTLLKKIEKIEVEEKDWADYLESGLLRRVQVLMQEQTGISASAMKDYFKEANIELDFTDVDIVFEAYKQKFGIDVSKEDFVKVVNTLKLEREYIYRKFLHLTWKNKKSGIIGDEGIRSFPTASADDYLIALVINGFMLKGLPETEWGPATNPTLDDRTVMVYGLQKKKGHKIEPKVISHGNEFGEVEVTGISHCWFWSWFDEWNTGKKGKEVPNVDTSNFHNEIDTVVGAALEAFYSEHPHLKGRVSKNIALKAFRSWVLITFHPFARALKSAKVVDKMYYFWQFFDYNKTYSEKGYASWMTALPLQFFGDEDANYDIDANNPVMALLGDNDEVEGKMKLGKGGWPSKFGAWLVGRIDAKNKGRSARRVMREQTEDSQNLGLLPQEGVTEDYYDKLLRTPENQLRGGELAMVKRYKKKGFFHYKWLLRPLMNKYRSSDEDFTMLPVFATLYLKGPDGKTMRFQAEDGQGGTVELDPISAFEVREAATAEYVYEEDPVTGAKTLRLDEEGQPYTKIIDPGKHIYEAIFDHQDLGTSIIGSIANFASVGVWIFDNLLKTDDVLKNFYGTSAASTKNNLRYALSFLPGLARIYASGHEERHDFYSYDYKVGDALITMLIVKSIFAGLVQEIYWNPDVEKRISIQEAKARLDRLVQLNVIDHEDSIAVYSALKGAFRGYSSSRKALDRTRQKLESRFKRT